ncbi:MAG: O-antigen ligase family protein [Firmicutes bacterium]|nr:O-antigen ligase family protein [Bacillota bacterium]
MRIKIQDGLKTSINVYLVLILLILPLYAPNGYVMIGDIKYLFFRNMTLFFAAVTAMMCIAMAVMQDGERKKHIRLSYTDIMVLLYGAGSIMSWCCSADRTQAWWGAPGWYMGLLSQLMFVWIYFAVARWCDDFKGIAWAFYAGAAAVMALGILNRYVFDPFSMFVGLDDWNRTHLLSTIGNQNWYCGYLSVASAVCIYFACAEGKTRRAAGLTGCLLLFWTILTQGSEGGYLILLAEMTVVFLWSLKDRRKLLAVLNVWTCCPVAVFIGKYCIRFRGLMLVEDGTLAGGLFWKGWLPVLFVLVIFSVLLCVREKRGYTDRLKAGTIQKIVLRTTGILLVIGVAVFLACQIWDPAWFFLGGRELLRITDSWGNGRGALWRICAESFMQGSFSEKLIGVGPDCLSNVIYALYPVNDIIHAAGQWETAYYANAHNEWLNMLVNQGILGLLFYGGIFVTLFVRLWKHRHESSLALMGLLAMAGYCAYGTVSFQQAVSTPLIFAVMGISEAMLRKKTGETCKQKELSV